MYSGHAMDRWIGAASAACLGIFLLTMKSLMQQREKAYRKSTAQEEQADSYYELRFKVQDFIRSNCVEHEGSCHCGQVMFRVLAPVELVAFDTLDNISSKKGRYPQLMVPVEHLSMRSSISTMGTYVIPREQGHSKHLFCKFCGIHVFHCEEICTDYVYLNVYCIDQDKIRKLTVSFVPPTFKIPFQSLNTPANNQQEPHLAIENDQDESNEAGEKTAKDSTVTPIPKNSTMFEATLLAWAGLEDDPCNSSYVNSSKSEPPPKRTTPTPLTRIETKKLQRQPSESLIQLQRYLQHHIPPSPSNKENNTNIFRVKPNTKITI